MYALPYGLLGKVTTSPQLLGRQSSRVKCKDPRRQITWLQSLLNHYSLLLGKSVSLFEPHFPYLSNGDNNYTYIIVLA